MPQIWFKQVEPEPDNAGHDPFQNLFCKCCVLITVRGKTSDFPTVVKIAGPNTDSSKSSQLRLFPVQQLTHSQQKRQPCFTLQPR